VDFLLIRSKFSTLTCFGTWLPSSGGRECLIRCPGKVLCCGRVRVMIRPRPEDGTHMPKHVKVENLERINKKSTTSLSIRWSYCKRLYKSFGVEGLNCLFYVVRTNIIYLDFTKLLINYGYCFQ
jgi:hypothetical protein